MLDQCKQTANSKKHRMLKLSKVALTNIQKMKTKPNKHSKELLTVSHICVHITDSLCTTQPRVLIIIPLGRGNCTVSKNY